jgi:hypothetical protein
VITVVAGVLYLLSVIFQGSLLWAALRGRVSRRVWTVAAFVNVAVVAGVLGWLLITQQPASPAPPGLLLLLTALPAIVAAVVLRVRQG